MNKLTAFQTIFKALIELEQNSVKAVAIEYSTSCDMFYFSICKNKMDRSYLMPCGLFYVFSDNTGDYSRDVEAALKSIDEASLIPDGLVEKVLEFRIPESKAKELGLIPNDPQPA